MAVEGKAPKVSVIIPAFRCGHEIEGLLDDIGRTELSSYEVIVVDDASPDDTAERCEHREGVSVVRQSENRGPAAARNLGATRAKGEILIFVDSDVTLLKETDVLLEMVRAMECHSEVDLVSTISHVEPRVPGAIAYNSSIYHHYYMERILRGGDKRIGRLMLFTTRLGAVRARAFERSGGFLESLAGVMNEDGEYGTRCYHLGMVSYLHRSLVNLHRYPTDLRRYGRSYFHSARVQAQIDRAFDTSPDETISSHEQARRILALFPWVLVPAAVFMDQRLLLGAFLLWAVVLVASFGGMLRTIREVVPVRLWPAYFSVYFLITPVILAGYAYGSWEHHRGRSLIPVGPPAATTAATAGEK